jgi:hypothetical protein
MPSTVSCARHGLASTSRRGPVAYIPGPDPLPQP